MSGNGFSEALWTEERSPKTGLEWERCRLMFLEVGGCGPRRAGGIGEKRVTAEWMLWLEENVLNTSLSLVG